MAKKIIIEHEAADFGNAPEFLDEWEVLLGGRPPVKLYMRFRDGWRDGKMFTLRDLGAAVGMSANAVENTIYALEAHGFVSMDTDQPIPILLVRDVPFLPDDAEETLARVNQTLKDAEKETAKALLAYWNHMHRHYLLISYESHIARDMQIAKRIVNSVGLRAAKQVAAWYWRNRNQEDSADFGFFSVQYEDLARDRAEYERRTI